jgi:hypothetical protein
MNSSSAVKRNRAGQTGQFGNRNRDVSDPDSARNAGSSFSGIRTFLKKLPILRAGPQIVDYHAVVRSRYAEIQATCERMGCVKNRPG